MVVVPVGVALTLHLVVALARRVASDWLGRARIAAVLGRLPADLAWAGLLGCAAFRASGLTSEERVALRERINRDEEKLRDRQMERLMVVLAEQEQEVIVFLKTQDFC